MLKVIILTLVVICSLTIANGLRVPHDDEIKEHWNQFKATRSLKFSTEEEPVRFHNFRKNYIRVLEHNYGYSIGNHTFMASLNEMSHLSEAEYKKRLGVRGLIPRNNTSPDVPPPGLSVLSADSGAVVPDSFDWRSRNVVGPIKNQYSCGSCWAFSVSGVVESLYAIKMGSIRQLSEQNLMDCTYYNSYGEYGCNGGWPDYGFEYAKNVGLVDQRYFPYYARVGQCYNYQSYQKIRITGYYDMPAGNEEFMKKVVALVAPVSITMDASHWSFQSYSGGIYYEPSCNPQNLDHAMIIVGYGRENGYNYWLVKNSWGTNWGIGGYMKLYRGANMCGVTNMATYAY